MDGVVISASGPRVRVFSASARRWLCRAALASADIAASQLCLLLAEPASRLLGAGPLPWSPTLGGAVAIATVVAAAGCDLYHPAGLAPVERFRRRAFATAIMPLLVLATLGAAGSLMPEHVAMLAVAALLFLPFSAAAEATLIQVLVARGLWCTNVVVVGSGPAGAHVARALLSQPQAGLRPIGYFGDPAESGEISPVPRLGSLSEAWDSRDRASTAVVALSPGTAGPDLTLLPFRRIVLVPDLESLPVIGVRARAAGGVTMLEFAQPGALHALLKRLLDCAIAVPALVFVAPLILCCAIAILMISPGKVFYKQVRVGWNGRPITIFKLRSMHLDADQRLQDLLTADPKARREWDAYVKLSNDPRILPVIGNFMRKFSIDELPQLWNVVRGDLSIVGPRPFPHYHVERFSPAFQQLRCSVRPGLTGLWQVSGRSDADLRQQETLDTFYIRNRSLWFDIYIVLRTLPVVLSARGAS